MSVWLNRGLFLKPALSPLLFRFTGAIGSSVVLVGTQNPALCQGDHRHLTRTHSVCLPAFCLNRPGPAVPLLCVLFVVGFGDTLV